jgi:phospho-2-dehydro-3-deoxyheptonate aldolase
VVIGPCSLDTETDYGSLFDYVGELQDEHDALIALRANGSKPRTSGGWGGLVRSTDPDEQDLVGKIYEEAFSREIPIFTEVTDRDEFAALAPYLSAAWIGARDMESTALRSMASATRLPFLVKNGTSGNPGLVANAISAMRKGTAESEGSGVNLGMLGYTYRSNGVGLPAMVEVGGGNPNIGIIARGYELPREMPADEKTRHAIEHLSHLCAVAADVDSTVIIDGSHGVPPMFEIPRTEGDRFPRVMERIHEAIEQGEIAHADRLRGYIGEISTTEGRTDKNWLISQARQPEGGLSQLIRQPLPVSLA